VIEERQQIVSEVAESYLLQITERTGISMSAAIHCKQTIARGWFENANGLPNVSPEAVLENQWDASSSLEVMEVKPVVSKKGHGSKPAPAFA
jgi:hypothetical protein